MWYKFCTSSSEQKFEEYYRNVKQESLDHNAAWISPSGKVYFLPDNLPQHGMVSVKILGKNYEDLIQEGWIRYRSNWQNELSSNVQFHKKILKPQMYSIGRLHGKPNEGTLFYEDTASGDFGEKWSDLKKFAL